MTITTKVLQDLILGKVDPEVADILAVATSLPDGGALTSIAQEATLGVPAGASVSADVAAVKILVDAVQSTVDGIQNNTRLTASIPFVELPPSGSTAHKVIFNLYNGGGTTEDPDNDILAVTLTQVDGIDVTARLYKEVALSNALDVQSGGTFNGLSKLVKDSTGR